MNIRLTLFCLLFTGLLSAQERYIIQVGHYQQPNPADFEDLRPLGFVYTAPVESQVYKVLLGAYDNINAANQSLGKVKALGFTQATILQMVLTEGKPSFVVRLGRESSLTPIPWHQYAAADTLFAIVGEQDITLVSPPAATREEAQSRLLALQQAGFSKATIEQINPQMLTELRYFETGLKKPLFQLPVSQPPRASSPAAPAAVATDTSTPPYPGVKRNSALQVQTALKQAAYYAGSVDGQYGPQSAAAFRQFLRTDKQALRLLDAPQQPANARQQALNNMLTDTAAFNAFIQAPTALAGAWKAYALFFRNGPSPEVNQLMNAAIKSIFSAGSRRKPATFDTGATYAYEEVGQLLLHLHYLHSAAEEPLIVPYPIIQRHPEAMITVCNAYQSGQSADFRFRGCIPFTEWPDIRLLLAMARELGQSQAENPNSLALTQLYLSPPPPDPTREVGLENWNIRLWHGLDDAGLAKPLLNSFRVVFYQSFVSLEDHFMSKGNSPAVARKQALQALQLMTNHLLTSYF
jgi:hypothetical protein